MLIGIFADTHDHLDNIRKSVAVFNAHQCDLILFAGDFVSTFVLPPMRKLNAPMIACFGDNEGNKTGLYGGMTIIGKLGEPPFGFKTECGKKILLTHQLWLIKDYGEAEIIVYAHTHKAKIHTDDAGRLFINPGEASGWSNGKPSVALLDTETMQAEHLWLDDVELPV
ncbi:MAG: YfcE family phosphodiesterase [Blastopirellula sp.]|nr:MAG: YfcE family phosphodiesterase [Blastopirellula sp.]